MADDLYAILGVSPDADDEEIRRAYREHIRQAHPDLSPEGEEEARRLNVAYETLSDPNKRRMYDRARQAERCPMCGVHVAASEAPHHAFLHMMETAMATEGCEMCSRLPTADFSFRANSGFILWRQVYGFEGRLCRVCSQGTYRDFQARNLTRGWWGIISFFATWWYLLQNQGNLSAGRRGLSHPRPADPVADEVLAGRPVFRRPSVLVVVGLLGLFFISGTLSDSGSSTNSQRSANPPSITSPATSQAASVEPEGAQTLACSESEVVDALSALVETHDQVVEAINEFVDTGNWATPPAFFERRLQGARGEIDQALAMELTTQGERLLQAGRALAEADENALHWAQLENWDRFNAAVDVANRRSDAFFDTVEDARDAPICR